MARPRIVNDEQLIKLFKQGETLAEIGRQLNVSSVAIHKKVKRLGLTRLPESMAKLTGKRQAFVLAVASGQSRINAAMSSFDVTSKASAKALQQELMKDPGVKLAIDDLMELKGIGRDYRIDKLKQHIDHHDPVISLKSLDMAMKAADDSGERRNRLPNDIKILFKDADLAEYRNPAGFTQIAGQCSICSVSSDAGLCEICCKRYPALTDKIARHWAGDVCAVCEDERRCYAFCNECKANHA